MNNLERVEKILNEAVAEAQSRECNIVRGDWGVDWNEDSKKWKLEGGKCCCPMGAVLLKFQPPPVGMYVDGVKLDINFSASVASYLGITENEVNGFIQELDDASRLYPTHHCIEDLGNKFAFKSNLIGPSEDDEDANDYQDDDNYEEVDVSDLEIF